MKQIKQNKSLIKTWHMKTLTLAVMAGLCASATQAGGGDKNIGDLEIYKPAEEGVATILMMLDLSGSMDGRSIKSDYGDCKEDAGPINALRVYAYLKNEDGSYVTNANGSRKDFGFTPNGCEVNIGTNDNPDYAYRTDRISRLKDALIKILSDEVYVGGTAEDNKLSDAAKGSLPDDYEIGIGTFADNRGKIIIPVKKLTDSHRATLLTGVRNSNTSGSTPTPQALADSGAYMMGTSTKDGTFQAPAYNTVGYLYNHGSYYGVYICHGYSQSVNDYNGQGTFNGALWQFCASPARTRMSGGYTYDQGANYFGNLGYDVTNERGRYTYFMKYEANATVTSNPYSGFDDSVSTSKNSNETQYSSPVTTDECSGNGIYFLTDGEPNTPADDNVTKSLMNRSLTGSSLRVSSCDVLADNTNKWGCMAEYAALLRNPNNPSGQSIKTATVGFGKSFAGLTGTRTIQIQEGLDVVDIDVIDCDSGSVGRDTKNLCKLGERRGYNETKTFGDGGFYYTEESSEIGASISDFASTLIQTIDTAPSGTITVPDNPYQASQQLAFAYLPMLEPQVDSSTTIWRGNLKKYSLANGTVYGKSSAKLFENVAGDLLSSTQDLWQESDYLDANNQVANNSISAGGVYARLKAPNASDLSSVRTVWVEDFTTASNKTPVLRKIGVNTSGKPVGFDQLVDTGTYTELNKRRLLSFLGYDSVLNTSGQPTDATLVEDLTLSAPAAETRLLGGVVHSNPAAISYSASLDENGRITSTRDDYALFGSMDGALHLVDADNGEETFAFIPKSMLENQPEALDYGSIHAGVGEPVFGVDAPWLVITDYNYDLDNSKVTVDTSGDNGMFAYGGLRMGGEAFYGLDIKDKASPTIKFTITPTTVNHTQSNNFSRMGQIWSKPTEAQIRINKNDDPTDVLVFAGGYDMGYESDNYVPTTSAPAKGNAIYMINAKTGDLIWSTSGETGVSRNTKTDSMIHSIVGEVTVLDRDNDGLMDHIYAADLGGQVFRADFQNARTANSSTGITAVDSFANKGVTRVLNASASLSNGNKNMAYRFYSRPIVSFYRNQGISGQTVAQNGKIFAMVNVISGNRSSPLSDMRDNNDYANRVYGIIDTDITNSALFNSGFTATIKDLTDSNLVNLSSALGNSPVSSDTKLTVKNTMVNGSKNGWYYPLTRFDGYSNVRFNKGVGNSVVINSLLYTTVYNPDKLYGDVASCTATIQGGSERQVYCLPYGICEEEASKNGTGGYVPAGQGIQELTLGAYDEDNTDTTVLIGTTTLSERIDAANRTEYGDDPDKGESNIKDIQYSDNSSPGTTNSDGSAVEYIFRERYTLTPVNWYKENR